VIYVTRPSLNDTTKRDTIPSATGGRRLVVGTVEVTAPTPLFRGTVRVAGFVDGGRVWGAASPDLTSPPFRFTPGAGLRVASPVGPVRLDLAYNPYARPHGPLYKINANGDIEGLLQTDYQPKDGGFLRRLVVHISIGQTF
jgi:hypothetical protein